MYTMHVLCICILCIYVYYVYVYSPGGSDGRASACNAKDPGLIPGSGRSPGAGNGNPLQHSCLEKPMDRGQGYSPWGCKESDTTERLHFSFILCICIPLLNYTHVCSTKKCFNDLFQKDAEFC